MISVEEYFGQHSAGHEDEITDQMCANADALLSHVNALLEDFGEDRGLRSGWRPAGVNARVGGAKASKHMTGNAVDVNDSDGALKEFCAVEVLEYYGLYMESPGSTPSWCHLQCLSPGSGRRIFLP